MSWDINPQRETKLEDMSTADLLKIRGEVKEITPEVHEKYLNNITVFETIAKRFAENMKTVIDESMAGIQNKIKQSKQSNNSVLGVDQKLAPSFKQTFTSPDIEKPDSTPSVDNNESFISR